MFFKQFFGVEFPTDLKTGLHQTGRSNHHPLIHFLKVYFMVYRNKLSQYVQLRVFVQDPCPSSHGIAQMDNCGSFIHLNVLNHWITKKDGFSNIMVLIDTEKIVLLYYNIRIVVTGVVKCQPNIIIYFSFFLALRFGDITFSDITVTIMFQLNSNIIKTILYIIGTLW